MAVTYDPMSEAWEDDNDPRFKVSMTPEGGIDEYLAMEFETQEEFWEWYQKEDD